MKSFMRQINKFYIKSIKYTDTDSLFSKKYRDVSDKADFSGKNLCQGKND